MADGTHKTAIIWWLRHELREALRSFLVDYYDRMFIRPYPSEISLILPIVETERRYLACRTSLPKTLRRFPNSCQLPVVNPHRINMAIIDGTIVYTTGDPHSYKRTGVITHSSTLQSHISHVSSLQNICLSRNIQNRNILLSLEITVPYQIDMSISTSFKLSNGVEIPAVGLGGCPNRR